MLNDKIILGIDPGTTIMGYGLILVQSKKFELINMGVLNLSKLKTHELKLKKIFERTLQLIEEYKPDELENLVQLKHCLNYSHTFCFIFN